MAEELNVRPGTTQTKVLFNARIHAIFTSPFKSNKNNHNICQ